MKSIRKIAVIGAGSWGTALAKLLAENNDEVCLWAYEAEIVAGINQQHKNPLFLNAVELPKNLTATNDFQEALCGAGVVVSVVPSHVLRLVWQQAAEFLEKESLLISCTKGIEIAGFKLMHQVLDDCLPNHPAKQRAVLSGPSFAKEVAENLPTSVVIAGIDSSTTKKLQAVFRTQNFLPFLSDDIIAVQVGGAVKNVIALAAGLSDGLQLGHNAQAAIVTRGLYEMIKVGKALGANELTFAGLSGMGDLVLTATCGLSRNYSVGKAIGEGDGAKKVLGDTQMVAEGMETAHAVSALGKKFAIELPICDAVAAILRGELSPLEAVHQLTSRSLGDEMGALHS